MVVSDYEDIGWRGTDRHRVWHDIRRSALAEFVCDTVLSAADQPKGRGS